MINHLHVEIIHFYMETNYVIKIREEYPHYFNKIWEGPTVKKL